MIPLYIIIIIMKLFVFNIIRRGKQKDLIFSGTISSFWKP